MFGARLFSSFCLAKFLTMLYRKLAVDFEPAGRGRREASQGIEVNHLTGATVFSISPIEWV